MAEKQLIVVVDGTDALRPYWQTVLSDYLHKIIRCFCGNQLRNGQKLSEENPAFALVLFNSHAPYSAFLVQRTGWTKDLDVFLSWLSRIPFSGGGYGDAAIAEGLSDALKGRRNPQAADPTIDIATNSHFIVLISENFMEARAALSHPLMGNLTTIQGIVKPAVVSSSVVPRPASTSIPSVNGSIINRQQFPLGTIPFATVKVEPTKVPLMVSGSGYPSVSSQGVSSLQTSSPSPTSQEINVTNEVIQEHKPVGIPMSRTLHPVGPASGALMPMVQVVQNTRIDTFTPASSHISGESNMGISAALYDLQNSIGMVQSVQGMGQGNLPQSAQTKQVEISMAPSLMNELGSTNVSSAPATMNRTLGVNPYTLWIKIWKGSLFGQSRRYPNFRLYLEGYGDSSASKMLVADWPSSIQIRLIIDEKSVNWKHYVGKADILVFQILSQKEFFARLQEKKLCVVIKLPSQTLLLSVLDKAERLRGILSPGNKVNINPKVLHQQ